MQKSFQVEGRTCAETLTGNVGKECFKKSKSAEADEIKMALEESLVKSITLGPMLRKCKSSVQH